MATIFVTGARLQGQHAISVYAQKRRSGTMLFSRAPVPRAQNSAPLKEGKADVGALVSI